MATSTAGSAVGSLQDSRALDALRQSAKKDPGKAVKEAASQFEALFTRQLLKTMRDAMPKSGMFDGPGTQMFEQMLDDQLTQVTAGAPGGLGDMIAKHLSRYIEGSAVPDVSDKAANGEGAAGASRRPRIVAGMTEVNYQPDSSRDDPYPEAGSTGVFMSDLPEVLRNAMQPLEELSSLPEVTRAEAFVARLWPHAMVAEQRTGVPAGFVVGQAALESGWGRGEMRHPDGRPAHNLFGIKAGRSWGGEAVDVTTTEYLNGKAVRKVEKFRAYDNYADSFSDWVALMTRNPRYAQVLRATASPDDFARGLQSAGYATDPRYAEKLGQVIRKAMELSTSTGSIAGKGN